MEIDRGRFLLLTTALAACHRVAEPTHPPSAEAIAKPSMDVATMCAGVAREADEVLANASIDCPEDTEPAEGRKRLAELAREPGLHWCKPAGRGVWFVQLHSAELSAPAGESGRWCGATIRYEIDWAEGATRLRGPSATATAHADESGSPAIERQFDYDGDGRQELFVRTSHWENGGGLEPERYEVLRATENGVEPYPVGFRYTGSIDADEDGRPDLIDADYYGVELPCGLAGIWIQGPPLLVHSLPGGKFTMSDETSRRWAIGECPRLPPAPWIEPQPAACARIWGKTVDQVASAELVTRSCGVDEPGLAARFLEPEPPFAPLATDTPTPLPSVRATPKR